MPAPTVRLTANLGLDDAATGTQTGTVGEPSVAASSRALLVTGNWYAAWSPDAGTSWQLVDPFTAFPADRGRFCCDQLVRYLPKQRLWVWLLQYEAVAGANIVRLAVSTSGRPGTWHWWDVAPTDLEPSWTGVWFDYPDLAVTDQHLWISFNQYDSGDAWRRAVVIRYPVAELREARPVTRRHWATTSAGSLRFVAGAGDTMWFASTDAARRSVRLFAWPDASDSVTTWSVRVTAWDDRDYRSDGPGGAPWLSRADDRITGAWRAGGRLGFLWTAGRSPGRPHPYVRAVTLDEATLRVVAEPDLWSTTGAWAYPAAAPNRRGRVGVTAFFGGPTHPAHTVGVLDEDAGAWVTATTATSTHPPAQGKWGDYLTLTAHPSRPSSWVASGFTLQGGSDRRNIEPRVVTFRA
jgi:hypothetical protein